MEGGLRGRRRPRACPTRTPQESEDYYGAAQDLSTAHHLEQFGRLVQRVRFDVSAPHTRLCQAKDFLEVGAGTQIAAADRDTLQHRVHNWQFVLIGGEAGSNQSTGALERAESLLNGGGRTGQDDGSVSAAPLLL